MSTTVIKTKPVRVMHVTYDMRIGGTEQVIRNLIEGADTARLQQSVFCVEEPLGPWGVGMREAGVTIDSVARRPGFDWRVVRALRNQIREQQIDILHCHQYTPWAYGVVAALGTGVKVIFTEHGRFYPDVTSPKRRFINPLLCRRTQKITAISAATRRALAKFEYIAEERVEVIYNGIQSLSCETGVVKDLKQRLEIPESALVLGTIARLDPIKNHRMMIKAFRRVLQARPDSRLMLIGDGEERTAIERMVREFDLSNSVIMPGYISHPEAWLAAMDVFLLPSLSEGTSMTLLEALSLGKPCVVTDVGGNPEVVSHEKTGLVVKSDNDAVFAEACIRLLSSPDERLRYGSEGRKEFEVRFQAQTMTARYENLYAQVV